MLDVGTTPRPSAASFSRDVGLSSTDPAIPDARITALGSPEVISNSHHKQAEPAVALRFKSDCRRRECGSGDFASNYLVTLCGYVYGRT
jgi:hypothetical protein